MPFTNPSFPGQIFNTLEEFNEARRKRSEVEANISTRTEEITKVTATIIPAPRDLLEKKISSLEGRMQNLESKIAAAPTHNKEGLAIGTTLRGESRGQSYTLDILDEGYLCSDGNIYDSLSGAALGVSGNRRSGWKFWKDVAGTPIGEVTGRFKRHAPNNPFDSRTMP
jgi:hypothetical protein